MTQRPTMPAGLEFARATPEFSEQTIPAGLLANHKLAESTWGRLRVVAGNLRFVFESDPTTVHDLSTGDHIDIPPAIAHRVAPAPGCRFIVEFYRAHPHAH